MLKENDETSCFGGGIGVVDGQVGGIHDKAVLVLDLMLTDDKITDQCHMGNLGETFLANGIETE